jgi:hypothetical protein
MTSASQSLRSSAGSTPPGSRAPSGMTISEHPPFDSRRSLPSTRFARSGQAGQAGQARTFTRTRIPGRPASAVSLLTPLLTRLRSSRGGRQIPRVRDRVADWRAGASTASRACSASRIVPGQGRSFSECCQSRSPWPARCWRRTHGQGRGADQARARPRRAGPPQLARSSAWHPLGPRSE